LPPVVLVDAVAKVTGVSEKLGDLPNGSRAIMLGDTRIASEPLDLLGRCNRDGDCSSTASGGLALTLHRIHGDWLNRKLADPRGRLQQLKQRPSAEVVRELYRVALGRSPTDQEAEHWRKRLTTDDPGERQQRLEDFFWALLNSVEFTTNH
jgi:hypothetical protein